MEDPREMPTVGLARQQETNVVVPWLVRLRWFSLAALVSAGWAAQAFWHVHLPLLSVLLLLTAMAATNVALSRQLRSPDPRREALGAVLVLDVALLTGLLFFVGGPLNPLSIVYLVTITIAAVSLGHRWALGIAGLSNIAYATTFLYNRPLAFHDPSLNEHVLPLHLSGMWVAFAAATALIAHFVGRVSDALGQREQELVEARASVARSERLAALLSLGAGAAHELATPLSTIGTAAGELARVVGDEGSARAQKAGRYVDIIRSEISRCGTVLDQLSGRAGSAPVQPSTIDVMQLVDEVRHRLGESQSKRLDVVLPEAPRPITAPVEALRQTLIALVRNAFDASTPEQRVMLSVAQERAVRVQVTDRGRGMSPEVAARAGEPFFTTKETGAGLGLGLFLARAFADQMGGTIVWTSRPGAGTAVVLEWPAC